MEQETKMVFIAFASMTNYSNWKYQIALAANHKIKTMEQTEMIFGKTVITPHAEGFLSGTT